LVEFDTAILRARMRRAAKASSLESQGDGMRRHSSQNKRPLCTYTIKNEDASVEERVYMHQIDIMRKQTFQYLQGANAANREPLVVGRSLPRV